MDFILDHLLTLILFTPALVAVIVVMLPGEQVKLQRWVAFLGSLIPLALSLVLWVNFNPEQPGFQFQEQYVWYEPINSSFHVGIDGISLTMVMLTTFLTPLAILASYSIKDRVKAYMFFFLMLEMGMLGVFLSLDLLIFFVFWELGLVPMYFLINQWGSEKGEREIWGRKIKARTYASFKFMIYTMAGSLGLLLAIQLIGVVAGTFDMPVLFKEMRCPYRCPNCRFDDPGWCAAEIRCIWFLAPGAAALSRGIKILCWCFSSPCNIGDHLWRIGFLWPERLQTAGRLFICQPYGFRDSGYRRGGFCNQFGKRDLGTQRCRPADVQPRSLCSRYVLPGRSDLRTYSHQELGRIWRFVPIDPGLWGHIDLRFYGLPGITNYGWIYL